MKVIQDIPSLKKIQKIKDEIQYLLNKNRKPSRASRHLSIALNEFKLLENYIKENTHVDD